ncbi:MAG: zinc-ribbon domain-containing protein [Candidatus Bathyarchaeota archaeon]|nr:zinc-ribbon domain-containing protein [Candidatus Bathyarchaeota archaeon]
MAERDCPKCGKELAPNASFCPNCGAILARHGAERPRKWGLVTAGGILTIVAACIAGISGVLALWFSLNTLYGGYYHRVWEIAFVFQTLAFIGFFALIGFGFGLAAGIQSLWRKQFARTMAGTTLLMLAGILYFLTFALPDNAFIWALMFGLPIVSLSSLGLFFVALRKRDFD